MTTAESHFVIAMFLMGGADVAACRMLEKVGYSHNMADFYGAAIGLVVFVAYLYVAAKNYKRNRV